ncbi:MAG TPA: hypothetical protein DCF99_13185 [Flavobacteriaceae bacterium]|jgi:hypothetical protein|nr:hypothetical protein [Flavobacteriaceae bacterium]
MAFAILRAEKLKTMGNIGGSLAHNYRTIDTPNANPSQTPNNFHSLKDSEAVKAAISERLPEKRRSDAVLCIEYMITASPEWQGWSDDRQNEYFKQAVDWLEQRHGKQNVVATSIHRDETTPHLVAYVVPLDQETGKLNAKKFLGGKAKLAEMQSSFSNHVKNLGLKRGIEGSKAKHTRIKEYYAKVNEPTPQIRQVERPKAGIFETTAQYGDKVVNSVLEQIKPQWESMAELTKEVRIARKEALEARKTLLELQDRVRPYLDAIRPLSFSERIKLQEVMKATSQELQENTKQTEKQRKEQRQEAQAAQWEKIYVGLTSNQQIKAEFFLKAIEERYKNDPAMLNLKLDEAKNKIGENPAALDKVELPQIKQQQDIEVKISKNNSPQKQR